MSSQIKFRYTNAKDVDVVSFNGMSIGLEAFKSLVAVKKRLVANIDLVVTDESGREYTDDEYIPKDSTVVVKPKVGYVDTIDARPAVMGDSSFPSDTSKQISKTPASSELALAEMDFGKLSAIARGPSSGGVGAPVNDSSQALAQTYSYRVSSDVDPNAPQAGRLHHRFEGQGLVARGAAQRRLEKPGQLYICFGCQAVNDHLKADCPYLRGSRGGAGGADGSDSSAPRITPVPANPLFVARKDLFEQRISAHTTTQEPSKTEIPEFLKCFICNELLQDAVLLPCCKTPACDECARKSSLEGDRVCPKKDCGAPLNFDDIQPFDFLRNEVRKYLNARETAAAPAAPPQPQKQEQTYTQPMTMQAAVPAVGSNEKTLILSSDDAAAAGWGVPDSGSGDVKNDNKDDTNASLPTGGSSESTKSADGVTSNTTTTTVGTTDTSSVVGTNATASTTSTTSTASPLSSTAPVSAASGSMGSAPGISPRGPIFGMGGSSMSSALSMKPPIQSPMGGPLLPPMSVPRPPFMPRGPPQMMGPMGGMGGMGGMGMPGNSWWSPGMGMVFPQTMMGGMPPTAVGATGVPAGVAGPRPPIPPVPPGSFPPPPIPPPPPPASVAMNTSKEKYTPSRDTNSRSHPDRSRSRSRDPYSSRGRDNDYRSRSRSNSRSHTRSRSHSLDRPYGRDRDRDRDRDRYRHRDWDRDREHGERERSGRGGRGSRGYRGDPGSEHDDRRDYARYEDRDSVHDRRSDKDRGRDYRNRSSHRSEMRHDREYEHRDRDRDRDRGRGRGRGRTRELEWEKPQRGRNDDPRTTKRPDRGGNRHRDKNWERRETSGGKGMNNRWHMDR